MFANTSTNNTNYTVISERITVGQADSPRSLAQLLGCVLARNGISPVAVAPNRMLEQKVGQPLADPRKMR